MNNDKQITYRQYLISVGIIFVLAILLFAVFGNDSDSMSSFLSESFVFFALTILSSSLLLKDSRYIRYFALAFIIKILIGVFHYLYFIDPSYFSTSGEINMMHHEFQGVTDFLKSAVEDKMAFGILHMKLDGWVTHQEILSIIAIPLYFFGVKMMNIGPINAFCSLFASMNLLIVTRKYISNRKKEKLIILLLAYFPATLITTYFYRDIVGWCLMSIGLTMMYLAKNHISKILAMVIAIYCCYLQRNGYAVIPIALWVVSYMLSDTHNKKFYLGFILIASLFLISYVISLTSNEATEIMASNVTKWPIYLLPIKLIFGLIGPFPWTNILHYKLNPASAYYLSDYAMGCLNIGLVIGVAKNIKKNWEKRYLNESTVMGLLLLIMGIMNPYMHMTYVSIGIFFMIPYLIQIQTVRSFKKNMIIAILILIFLNLLVIATDINGLSSSLK